MTNEQLQHHIMKIVHTDEQLQHYMENPRDVEEIANQHNLTQQWFDWLYESKDMTVSQIVEDFFIHFDLVNKL